MAQTLEIEDLSGGVTDYYLNAPPNKMKSCDNLLINQYPQMGKLFTRDGSRLYSSAYPQIPAGAQRINTCLIYKNLLYVQSSQKLYYFKNSTGWMDILGPTGNNAFPSITINNYFSYATWNYHTFFAHTGRDYPKKVIKNSSGVPFIVEAGLPKINSAGITFSHSGGGTSNWLYRFVYRYEYTAEGNIKFVDLGSPSASRFYTAGLNVTIANIPVLSNGTTSNFDTANIKIEIYRTLNNGTIYYKVGSINNGTTTFVDSVPDATLQLNELLYTTGGVVDNDRPPKCLSLHIKRDTGYYANIMTDGNEVINYRLLQSVPGDIDAVPQSFFLDVDDEIIAVSSTKANVVLLCRNSIYRVDGEYDELGMGGMLSERISDTAGCVSGQSVVQALDGVFWAGADGIYFTDGFRVQRINTDFDRTYKTFVTDAGVMSDNQTFRIQGKYNKKKNNIWWTIQKEGSTDVNMCYILDLNWSINDKSTFTTANGKSFAPSAIEFDNGQMIRCDKRGYVLIHEDDIYVDPLIDTTIPASDWSSETIVYDMETVAFNFGTSSTRKYVTQVNISAESTTNLSLQIVSNNDDNRKVADLSPIRFRGNITWGFPDIYWGDHTLDWNKQGLVHEKRRMPAQNLRCNFKSIKLTNAKTVIISSDVIGTATINATAKTVTLTNVTQYDWPSLAVGYFIAFEADNFTREYEVIARTADVLTYLDPNNASSTNINQKWVLRGFPKGEILNLLNMSLVYEASGPTLNPYRTADSGEVGT